MAARDSPVDDPLPVLSDEQYRALREFVERHRHEDTCSTTPLRLARVLAEDKPATLILTPPEISPPRGQSCSPDEYLVALLDRIGFPYRQVGGLSGLIVASSAGRLDLLPTVKTGSFSDAYHRRLGVVFGYPEHAIDYFIQNDTDTTKVDLVESGMFDAEEVAYTRFACYDYPKTREKYEHHIVVGRTIKERIGQLARTWDLPELDALADESYDDEVTALKNGGRDPTPTLTIDFDWKREQPMSSHSRN